MRPFLACLALAALPAMSAPQTPPPDRTYLLRPTRVFDGKASHPGWVVLVKGDRSSAAGPAASVQPPKDAQVVDLPGATKGFDPRWEVPQGADWVKVYADYRWGPNGEIRPTFTLQELQLVMKGGEIVRSP